MRAGERRLVPWWCLTGAVVCAVAFWLLAWWLGHVPTDAFERRKPFGAAVAAVGEPEAEQPELEERVWVARALWAGYRPGEDRGQIRCRVWKPFRPFRRSDAVILALVNDGETEARFRHLGDGMLEHVALFLLDQGGRVAAAHRWPSPLFLGPGPAAPAVTLKAGEEDRHLIHPRVIVENHAGPPLKPGSYDFVVAFMYHGEGRLVSKYSHYATSNPIPVEVTAKDVFVLDP